MMSLFLKQGLTPEHEEALARIRESNELTDEEKESFRKYDGFRELKELNPADGGPGPGLIRPLLDIIDKYSQRRTT